MLFSRLPANHWRAILLLMVTQLSACGAGGQSSGAPESTVDPLGHQTSNANVSAAAPATYQLALNVSGGGYVFNDNVTLLCSDLFSYCNVDVDANSLETLNAVSRFGYAFNGWGSSTAPTLDLNIDTDTQITASFQTTATTNATTESADIGNCENGDTAAFRALHLGDSLTAGPVYRLYTPEPASIAFYEQQAGAHVSSPQVSAAYGYLIAGPRNGDLAQALPEDHYWKQSIAEQHATVDQFNAVVVALGSNDAVDIINGLDPDFIIENRVKPLLQWLGNKPVYWILPHYARWPTAMQNLHFKSTQDGFDCQCNGASIHTTAQCNIVDEMQACAVDQDLQQQTIKTFRAIHALRERLAALQDEYPNLIVVDAAQTIANASNGSNDLYTTMTPAIDSVHFSIQGAEWYAWLHAWLAMHGDAGCALPSLSKWQMPANEISMAAQLDAAP